MVRTAERLGFDLLGEPRLVRLNPNVPTKTRGNAALVARFGHGQGSRRPIGHGPEGPVMSYATGRDVSDSERFRLTEALWATVLASSAGADPGTDPALIVARRRPPAELYWEAVRRIVTLDEVRDFLVGTTPLLRSAPSGVGQIGAAAALAWPGTHPTWEAIAYRDPQRWGTDRAVDRASVTETVARHPELFLCLDPRTRRLLIAPHTPCPILFGVRATKPVPAIEALREIRSEPVERWMLFRTNQGTGDHVRRPWPVPPVPFTAGTLEGTFHGTPFALPGGHVRFELALEEGTFVRCMAFEPTKTLPPVVRSLRAGDRVRVWGGSKADATFRVEGLTILKLGARRSPSFNPRCVRCGRRMGSLGAGRGFRCPSCRGRSSPESRRSRRVRPEFAVGHYHPTPSARRHLAPRGPEPAVGPPRMR